jgi:hypothetical protein
MFNLYELKVVKSALNMKSEPSSTDLINMVKTSGFGIYKMSKTIEETLPRVKNKIRKEYGLNSTNISMLPLPRPDLMVL